MKIEYSKKFVSAFQRLSQSEKYLVLHTIEFFQEDPHHSTLKNHPLQKPMSGQNALSVSDDLRIIFREKNNYSEVLMVDIGDHEAVYLR